MLVKQNVTLILTNQLRMAMNAMAFSDPYTTPNGLAIPHHASVRLRLSKATAIKDKNGDKVGLHIQVQVKKNRVGPPLRKCSIPLYFASGIDNYGSWLKTLKQRDIVGSTNFTYEGQKISFNSNNFNKLLQNRPQLKQYLYSKLCQSLIVQYKRNDQVTYIDQEDVQFTDQLVTD